MQNFRILRVTFRIDYTRGYYVNALLSVDGDKIQPTRVTSINVDGTLLYYRGIGNSSGTSLVIEGAYYTAALNSQPTGYAGALIPDKVWGMK